MTDEQNKTILREIEEFVWISEQLQDEKLDIVLNDIVKIIKSPDIPLDKVPQLIMKLQGLTAKFAFTATWYKTYGNTGTGEAGKVGRYKKDMYYTAADATQKLVDALKYLVKGKDFR